MSTLSTKRQPSKNDLLASFTNGVKPDQELYLQEIAVQLSWSTGLSEIGILDSKELTLIKDALYKAQSLMESNKFEWREEDEDIHMNLERFVNDETQGLGKKMHAGRSRNDLIATTLKLHVAASASLVITGIEKLITSMVGLAEKNLDVLIPGMTHLQNGQPIRWSHALLAHAWAFKRDIKKFETIKENALSSMPLGSAALAGTTLPIDLTKIATELGFNSLTLNSYDAVGDRDSVVDFMQATAHFGAHLSRLAEDIIYWSSAPVGLVELSPNWSTGSSIMPNKRNPDIAELARGKAAVWMGEAAGVLTLLKGVPTSYASDLHEIKIPYLRTVKDIELTLSIFPFFISELTLNSTKASALLNQGHILATEMANHLTDKGVPFREAYQIISGLVELAENKGTQVHELPITEIQTLTQKIDKDFLDTLTFKTTVEKRHFSGGTARDQLVMQLKVLGQK